MKHYATNRANVPYYEVGRKISHTRPDGIQISVRIEYDEYPMGAEDYLGKLTDSSRNKTAVKIERENFPNSWEDSECYFIPSNPFKDRRAYYAKHGYSRHEAYTLARKELMADYDLLRKFYDGDQFSESVIIVTVSYNTSGLRTIELGSASCGGILSGRDSDDSQPTYEETAFDLTREAVSEALVNCKGLGAEKAQRALQKLETAYSRLATQRYNAQRREIKLQRVSAWRDGKCPACHGSNHAPFSANERKLGDLVGFRGERKVNHGVWVDCPHCGGRPDYRELK